MVISIHAPREGGDEVTGVIQVIPCTISIHAPREGGDAPQLRRFVLREISIHAPREGGDDYEKLDVSGDGHFNPRPREGGDAVGADESHDVERFQSTPPARGATHRHQRHRRDLQISIHAPREGGDPPRSGRPCCR